MSSKKKKLLKTILAANGGCGRGCSRPKPSDVYEPTPVPKTKSSISQKDANPCSTSSSCDKSAGFTMDNEQDSVTSTTITFNIDNSTSTQNSESETDPKSSKIINSIAVVKDSDDPYQDFKHSMLQMILEKEIYSKDDLQELLNCFLELNSPCQHDVIVQAFTDIWHEVISKRPNSQKPCDGGVSHES